MRHAPSGGVWVSGDWYAGGQFLPDGEPSPRCGRASARNAGGALRVGTAVPLVLSDAPAERCRVLRVEGQMARCACTDHHGVERLTWVHCAAIRAALTDAKEMSDARAA